MSSQIPRPKKSSLDLIDINKSLPPLPPEPSTPPKKILGRSISYSVLRPPASAPVSRNREASCDFPNLAKLKTELFGADVDRYGSKEPRKHVCNVSVLINRSTVPVPDDPELYESPSWWAGRYMAISDRLRGEMPRAIQEERDEEARLEMIALCGGNIHKQRSLKIWWINFNMKQDQREETRKQKAVV
ncbi:hypothetical protein AOL_s00075g46 [Orbilia oligospora ATCC 24927]|uniref:Uncharacterized protein n=2 Tax=Orbilia oligospora TaxID=2813651 RepID=G1X847_ARTOA|nr:hypothetical protein AOL_s00075g46 [Orbilia oligospora ATCC 24927]EGX50620.1 hypothetical protein AOL_s00075g46 [Orbilia oligospora ATCC 24927]KAF3282041.1 hypothetical protein TWF970_001984 [Orbilia oligospora]